MTISCTDRSIPGETGPSGRAAETARLPCVERDFIITRATEHLLEPVEGELLREPIPDADVPCPACGGRAWLRIERRSEPEELYTRLKTVACATCGLSSGGWESTGRRRPGHPEDEPWTEQRPDALPEDPTVGDVVRMAPFVVLSPGPKPRLRSYGWRGEDAVMNTAEVEEGGVSVSSEVLDPVVASFFDPIPHARRRLALDMRTWGASDHLGLSAEALELADAHSERQVEEAIAAVAPRAIEVPVDGEPTTFLVIAFGGRWIAVARIDDRSVTVAGSDEVAVEDVVLRSLRP